ncbi:MAG: LacI family DNA-binding transcriptional regulator [Phycisphaeraceae bacterium]|nr:LacI family DNA-binding transcriptional regulator [Phycisphaeraceae bacterium]
MVAMESDVKRPTLAQIGRQAGVARETVSAVLNGRERQCRIAPETSARIRAVAQQLNYRPNRLVQSLRTGRTHMVALILPVLNQTFFPKIVAGVETQARQAGYHVLISQVANGLEDEAGEVEALLQCRVDGLILVPRPGPNNLATYRNLLAEKLPLVFVNGVLDDVPCAAAIGDDFRGAYQATEHLIRLGHQRIAHLVGNPDLSSAALRLAGYRQAMRDHGLPTPESFVQGQGFTVKRGRSGTELLLALPQRPTAVFACNDLAALGSLQAVWEAGLHCPRDVAVVGYGDDLLEPWSLKVPLTTMRVDGEELGRQAMAMLLEQMRQPGPNPGTLVKLNAELVVRQSCGADKTDATSRFSNTVGA